MARKIVITSGKGGVGKTTLCANLGLALSRRGLRVALLDLDMGLNNLDVALHIDSKVVFDMIDVVEGRCRATQALIQHDSEPTLFIMPSCHNPKHVVSADAVKKLISRLEDNFDYIFIDCPAGIETGFRRAIGCADEALVVVTPHLSSVRDADKVLQSLAGLSLNDIFIVVNRVRGDLVMSGEMLDSFEVFSLLGFKPLGIIPEDDDININTTASQENRAPYDILADNLHFGGSKMYDCITRYKGIFGKMRSKIKRRV
jgi:septum site-determining protein MinD